MKSLLYDTEANVVDPENSASSPGQSRDSEVLSSVHSNGRLDATSSSSFAIGILFSPDRRVNMFDAELSPIPRSSECHASTIRFEAELAQSLSSNNTTQCRSPPVDEEDKTFKDTVIDQLQSGLSDKCRKTVSADENARLLFDRHNIEADEHRAKPNFDSCGEDAWESSKSDCNTSACSDGIENQAEAFCYSKIIDAHVESKDDDPEARSPSMSAGSDETGASLFNTKLTSDACSNEMQVSSHLNATSRPPEVVSLLANGEGSHLPTGSTPDSSQPAPSTYSLKENAANDDALNISASPSQQSPETSLGVISDDGKVTKLSISSTEDPDLHKLSPTEHYSSELEDQSLSAEDEDTNVERHTNLNDSIITAGSVTEEDLIETKKQLGATSLAFIQQLKGAAFRRKLNLAKSRDSLAAKEKQQREMIAAAQAAKREQRLAAEPDSPHTNLESLPISSSVCFKARPLPETNGFKGSGGLSGVPKVEKKPPTIAFSPLLGRRRQRQEQESASIGESVSIIGSFNRVFRAKPIPKTTGEFGAAGQAGLPKIAKRAVTIPKSPLLGQRRTVKYHQTALTNAVNAGQAGLRKVQKRLVTIPQSPLLGRRREQTVQRAEEATDTSPNGRRRKSYGSQTSSGTQPLVGLELLHARKENVDPITRIAASPTKGYEPHSTLRAQKRAEYDVARAEYERQREEQERLERAELIKALEKDLDVLREKI